MIAAAIVAGAALCWRAPMPEESAPVLVRVQAIEPARLPSGGPAWWVQAVDAKLQRAQWMVPVGELGGCGS